MIETTELVKRVEVCTVGSARRVAALLDLDPDTVAEGQALPRGWHFILLGADTRRAKLRADGFPGLGVPMPDIGLPRLLLGGRTVEYQGDILIGDHVQRASGLRNLTKKDTGSEPMAIVTIGHELTVAGEPTPAIVETQTYILLSDQNRAKRPEPARKQVLASRLKTVTPDETLLFQYSALGFNSHKIHIDKAYARDIEGFPDLVVNGGLTTLLLSEFAREDLGLVIRSLKMKNVAPLFSGRLMTLTADRKCDGWRLAAYDDNGQLAAEMMVEVQ